MLLCTENFLPQPGSEHTKDFGVKCFVVGVEVKFDEIVLMRGRFGCKINDDVDVDVGEVEIDNCLR
ncbi:1750_t:CDS:2 [Entrophospora sp. SA101]|nr:1750_t:CDS:2 [Entrophospora sp. SA101]